MANNSISQEQIPPVVTNDDADVNPPKRQKVGYSSARKSNQQLRMKGKEYTGFEHIPDERPKYRQNKRKPGRIMGPACTSKTCANSKKRKCNEVSENDRENLFNTFWNDMDWNAKKVYIPGLIDAKETRRPSTEKEKSRRQTSFYYHLNIDGNRVHVCQTMFLHTFDIRQKRAEMESSNDGKICTKKSAEN